MEYNGITGFSVQKYFADKPIEVIEEVTDVPEPTPEPTEAPTVTEAPTAAPVLEETNTPVEDSEGNKLPFVIGGIAGVALLAIIGVCVVRRNRNRKK